ncbi:hypothetical protein dsx2_2979 [Desulfovibrio sp. X2]|uniref:amphi-Trp domain-containing protein n=1 Tax=Desulfovibrio sp. X2 TaxID=941449 RepID=UPI000358B4FE|nr:amphi-Trp domain-containing protein [Desulfovibrio sp. X2]EPR41813.1 hypothetical protein dsx2_2979 [Desulfovibrio sp. X2]
MSKSKVFEIEEEALAYNAGVLVERVAQGLCRGRIEMEGDAGQVALEVPKEVKISCSAKKKEKDGGAKCKVEIEISWYIADQEPCGDCGCGCDD